MAFLKKIQRRIGARLGAEGERVGARLEAEGERFIKRPETPAILSAAVATALLFTPAAPLAPAVLSAGVGQSVARGQQLKLRAEEEETAAALEAERVRSVFAQQGAQVQRLGLLAGLGAPRQASQRSGRAGSFTGQPPAIPETRQALTPAASANGVPSVLSSAGTF